MEPITAQARAADLRVFVTNGGAHPPSTLADMTLSQVVDPFGSNPAKLAELREAVLQLHAAVQLYGRRAFQLVGPNPIARLQFNAVLTRDLATSLDMERKQEL